MNHECKSVSVLTYGTFYWYEIKCLFIVENQRFSVIGNGHRAPFLTCPSGPPCARGCAVSGSAACARGPGLKTVPGVTAGSRDGGGGQVTLRSSCRLSVGRLGGAPVWCSRRYGTQTMRARLAGGCPGLTGPEGAARLGAEARR